MLARGRAPPYIERLFFHFPLTLRCTGQKPGQYDTKEHTCSDVRRFAWIRSADRSFKVQINRPSCAKKLHK